MHACLPTVDYLLAAKLWLLIVLANNTSTTQFVFGQERSLFPHPKTRNINQGKSKEINLSATKNPAKNRVQKGEKKKR